MHVKLRVKYDAQHRTRHVQSADTINTNFTLVSAHKTFVYMPLTTSIRTTLCTCLWHTQHAQSPLGFATQTHKIQTHSIPTTGDKWWQKHVDASDPMITYEDVHKFGTFWWFWTKIKRKWLFFDTRNGWLFVSRVAPTCGLRHTDRTSCCKRFYPGGRSSQIGNYDEIRFFHRELHMIEPWLHFFKRWIAIVDEAILFSILFGTKWKTNRNIRVIHLNTRLKTWFYDKQLRTKRVQTANTSNTNFTRFCTQNM